MRFFRKVEICCNSDELETAEQLRRRKMVEVELNNGVDNLDDSRTPLAAVVNDCRRVDLWNTTTENWLRFLQLQDLLVDLSNDIPNLVEVLQQEKNDFDEGVRRDDPRLLCFFSNLCLWHGPNINSLHDRVKATIRYLNRLTKRNSLEVTNRTVQTLVNLGSAIDNMYRLTSQVRQKKQVNILCLESISVGILLFASVSEVLPQKCRSRRRAHIPYSSTMRNRDWWIPETQPLG